MLSKKRGNRNRFFSNAEGSRRYRSREARSLLWRGRSKERGSVSIMTAILMVGLVSALGMSIDVARIYMVRSGLQNAADAAALAAARELNSGTSGLSNAVAQANAIVNYYDFNRTGLTAPKATIQEVDFAASVNGPWYNGANAASGVASTIKFVRVITQAASVSILFAVKALGATHSEQAIAVAGESVPLNTVCDFFPAAVALTNTTPANGTQMTLNFTDGTGTSTTVANFGYLVLGVPVISGNGSPETANLAAGITTICASVGSSQALSQTPSANKNDGPRQMADGANTRFDVYQQGYSNALTPTTYPPDTNIYDPLTGTQYLNGSPFLSPSDPGQQDRRVLIMAIISPGTYTGSSGSQITVPIQRFGAFLLTSQVPRNGKSAGAMQVEYLGNNFVMGRGSYDPNNTGSSTLTKPVLYPKG